MMFITQLTAQQPEVKLLLPGTNIHCSILHHELCSTDQPQAPLTIGWRMIDRSQSAASPDCVIVTDVAANTEVYQLDPHSNSVNNTVHNLKEFCVNSADYKLTGNEQVTLLLEIDTDN
jgi:hypothetical protein